MLIFFVAYVPSKGLVVDLTFHSLCTGNLVAEPL